MRSLLNGSLLLFAALLAPQPVTAADTPAPDDNLPPATAHEAHEPAPDATGANQTRSSSEELSRLATELSELVRKFQF